MFLLRASTAIRVGLMNNLAGHETVVRALYLALPTERAADQAGRRLTVASFGPAPDTERGKNHDVLLFGADDGPAPSELHWRMIANLMFLPNYSGAAAIGCFQLHFTDEARAVRALSELIWPGEGEAFASALASDTGFRQARKRLVDGMEAADPLDEPAVVWQALRRLVLEAETAAGEVAGMPAAAL
jgi:hypothetical protein